MIDDDVNELVRGAVKSVWALELLLFMRAHAARPWGVEDLVRETRSSLTIVTDGLASFEIGGLVRREAGEAYRYEPASADLGRVVDRLATLYEERRMSVVKMIMATSNEKLQGFADAFKLKKE